MALDYNFDDDLKLFSEMKEKEHYFLLNISSNDSMNWNDSSSEINDLELLSRNWQSFLIILYSLTAALSLIGNLIVIWVLLSGKRSSKELKMFLVNLSLSDITMAIFSIPFTYTDFILGRWIFSPSFCPIVQFMQVTSVFVSVYTLTAIGIDRYIAILHPITATLSLTKASHLAIVILIWLSGISLGLVTWTNSIAEPFSWGNQTYYDCKETWEQSTGQIYTCLIFTITFALPMIILSYVYGSVAYKVFHHSAPGHSDPVRDQQQQQAKIKIIKMLLTIVILFALCWLPIQSINLLLWFQREWLVAIYQTDFGYQLYIWLFISSHWLSMANSFVNPIIYCFMSDNFRADLKMLITTRCFKLNHQLNHRTTAKANELTIQMVDFDKNTNTNQNEFTTQFTKLTKTQIYEVN